MRKRDEKRDLPFSLLMLLVELQQHLLCPLVVGARDNISLILKESVELDQSIIEPAKIIKLRQQ